MISIREVYPFGMMMPGRKFSATDTYRYGFNGQEKSDEVVKGSFTAEFWEYDSRIGRRWNIDPVPIIGISDYSSFGNNPNYNIDPNGAFFFGLFGSNSKQRQAARTMEKETGGKIKNFYKKDIHVVYKKWEEQSSWSYSNQKNKSESDPTMLKGIISNIYRTYFNKDGTNNSTDFYSTITKSWHVQGTIKAYEPDAYDKWSQSENILKKFSYSIANSAYITGQNLITKRITGNPTTSLTDQVTTPNENVDAFVNTATNFIPIGKGAKGFTYIEKLNAAQFSKFFKGTFILRSGNIVRGKANKLLNFMISQYNDFVPSGAIVYESLGIIEPKEEK